MAKNEDAGDGVSSIDKAPAHEVAANVPISEEVDIATRIERSLNLPPKSERNRGRFNKGEGQFRRLDDDDAGSRKVERVGEEKKDPAKVKEKVLEQEAAAASDDISEDDLAEIARVTGVDIELPPDEEPEGEEEPEPEPEQPAAPAPSDSELLPDAKVQEILAAMTPPRDYRTEGFERREVARERAARERAEGLLDVALRELANRRAAATPPPPAEEEEDVDIALEPEKWAEREVEKRVSKRLEPMQVALDQVTNELRQMRQGQIEAGVREAERVYERDHPGHQERIAAARTAAYNEFLGYAKGDEAQATAMLKQMDAGIAAFARQYGLNPFEHFDKEATKYLRAHGLPVPSGAAPPPPPPNGTPPPPPPRRPSPRRDGSIAAAEASLRSSAARSLSDGGGTEGDRPLTAAELVARGVNPTDFHRALETGGIDALMELVGPLERTISRQRGFE